MYVYVFYMYVCVLYMCVYKLSLCIRVIVCVYWGDGDSCLTVVFVTIWGRTTGFGRDFRNKFVVCWSFV